MGRYAYVADTECGLHVVDISKNRPLKYKSFGKPGKRPVVGMVMAQIDGRDVLFYSVGRNLLAVDVNKPEAAVWKKPFYCPGGDVTPPPT